MLLYHAPQRPRAHVFAVPPSGQPVRRLRGQGNGNVAFRQLRFQLQDELFHDPVHHFPRQRIEGNDRIKTIAELGREHPVDGVLIVTGLPGTAKSDGRFRQLRRPHIGGHDQDHVAEIHRFPVIVGQLAMVHDLQQHTEQVGMRLFDLVQQHHAMGVLIDPFRQKPPLVKSHISRGRANEAGNGMPLHILGHVKAQHLHPQRIGQLASHFRLADPRRTGKQVRTNGFFRLTQPGTGQLDGGRQGFDGAVLPENHPFQVGLQIGQQFRIRTRDGPGWNAGHGGNCCLDVTDTDQLLALVRIQQHLGRTGLIHHVDCLVRQLAIADITRRKFHRRLHGIVSIFQLVKFLEIGFQPLHDRNGIRNAGLGHVDLLEPPHKRPVLFEKLPELLVGRGTNTPDVPGGQRGLEQVGGIHGPAGGCSRPYDGMDFINEKNDIGAFLQLLHYRLEPLFEIPPIAGSRQQRAHVQRVNFHFPEDVRHLPLDDLEGQPLRDCRLADPRIPHIERIVLGTAAQDLNGPVQLRLPPDQRIDLLCPRLLVQVDAIFLQGGFLFPSLSLVPGPRLAPLSRLRVRKAAHLGYAMGNEIDRIEPGHVLPLKEIGRMAFPLGKDGHQHVGPVYLGTLGRLHMNDSPLNDPLKCRRIAGFRRLRILQVFQFLVQKTDQVIPQFHEIDFAGTEHQQRIPVVQQCQQKMLKGRELVGPVPGIIHGSMKRLFKTVGK